MYHKEIRHLFLRYSVLMIRATGQVKTPSTESLPGMMTDTLIGEHDCSEEPFLLESQDMSKWIKISFLLTIFL